MFRSECSAVPSETSMLRKEMKHLNVSVAKVRKCRVARTIKEQTDIKKSKINRKNVRCD